MGEIHTFETLDYQGKLWVDAEKHLEIVTRLQKAEADYAELLSATREFYDQNEWWIERETLATSRLRALLTQENNE